MVALSIACVLHVLINCVEPVSIDLRYCCCITHPIDTIVDTPIEWQVIQRPQLEARFQAKGFGHKNRAVYKVALLDAMNIIHCRVAIFFSTSRGDTRATWEELQFWKPSFASYHGARKLSDILYAIQSYKYEEVGLATLYTSDSLEESTTCEVKDETLLIQSTRLLVIFTEALQVFSLFHQQWKKKGCFLGDWKRWDCLSRFLLFVQPSQSTVWNFRKLLLLQNHATPELELQVNSIALKKDAKTSEVWHHRKWIFRQLTRVVSWEWIQRELDLCFLLVNRFDKPYYVWCYRWWLVCSYRTILPDDFVAQEYETTSKQAIQQHVSDPGAYFYRQKLLLCLLKRSTTDDSFVLLSSEWDWIQSVIQIVDRSFESPFYYIEFLYCCCNSWLDRNNAHQQSLMDRIVSTLGSFHRGAKRVQYYPK